jgi:hypothetical protein
MNLDNDFNCFVGYYVFLLCIIKENDCPVCPLHCVLSYSVKGPAELIAAGHMMLGRVGSCLY